MVNERIYENFSIINNAENNFGEFIPITQSDNEYEGNTLQFTKIIRPGAKFTTILSYILIIISTILYLITLTGCSETQAECLRKFDQSQIKYFAMTLVLSAFGYTTVYTMFIFAKANFIISLIQTITLVFLCFFYDTGTDLKSHGSFNRAFLFILMFVLFILEAILVLIFKILRRRPIIGMVILLMISSALGVFGYNKLLHSCDHWRLGLKNTSIDNSVSCKVKEPEYCWMNVLDNVLDISGWLGENCEQIRMDSKEQLLQWTLVKDVNIAGYPRVEDWRWYPDSVIDIFQFSVLRGVLDMEKVTDVLKNRTEIIIDFKQQPPKLEMRITPDAELIKSRRDIYKQLPNPQMARNFIHISIDSVSRDNFRRKLPKSFKWLEKYYDNTDSEAEVFQFFKFHSIGPYTIINMIPAMYGVEATSTGNANFYTKYFKDNGYITGQSFNMCMKQLFDLEGGNVGGFNNENFDHENNHISCDPNYTMPRTPFAILNGPYGMKRRCLYGKDTSEYVFEYGKLFLNAYKDEPKFLRLGSIDAHEGTAEVVKYMDDKLFNFFNYLESGGSLKDTVIIIQSDHGVTMPGLYTFIDAEDFQIEKMFPILYMIIPRDIAKRYRDTVRSKEQVMVSPYDIHSTIMDLAGAPVDAYSKLGVSLFKEIPDIKERNCDKFGVLKNMCYCTG
jgi:hypothetical protein